MKKFMIKVVLFVVLVGMLLVPVNLLIDPYNVFHADHMRDNGVEPNKNYIKTRFILNNQETYDSYLFGSSRVGFIDVTKMSEYSGERYYNMMYSEGLPAEHLKTLQVMIARGEIPDTVVIGVDDISYMVDPARHESQLYRIAYPYGESWQKQAGFYLKYMDTYTTLQSLSVISNHKPTDISAIYTTGCEDLNRDTVFDETQNTPYWADYYENRMEESLQEIAAIRDLCQENEIKLIVFTNPLYYATYEKDVRHGYLDFLEKLAGVVPYYNFSGYNEITLSKENYFETSHYRPQVGDKIIDVIFKGETDETLISQGFGVYVTRDGEEELMKILKHQVASLK